MCLPSTPCQEEGGRECSSSPATEAAGVTTTSLTWTPRWVFLAKYFYEENNWKTDISTGKNQKKREDCLFKLRNLKINQINRGLFNKNLILNLCVSIQTNHFEATLSFITEDLLSFIIEVMFCFIIETLLSFIKETLLFL